MGSASQLFWYLNAEIHPTKREQAIHYTHIDITKNIKALRREYRHPEYPETILIKGGRGFDPQLRLSDYAGSRETIV